MKYCIFIILTVFLFSCVSAQKSEKTESETDISNSDLQKLDIVDTDYTLEEVVKKDTTYYHYRMTTLSRGDIALMEQDIINHLDKIIPGKTSYFEIVELVGKPPYILVIKYTDSERLYHIYGNIEFYFGSRGIIINEMFITNHITEFAYKGNIEIGSDYQVIIDTLGEPVETRINKKIDYKLDRVLFLDVNGKSGEGYIEYKDIGVKFYISNNKVSRMSFKYSLL